MSSLRPTVCVKILRRTILDFVLFFKLSVVTIMYTVYYGVNTIFYVIARVYTSYNNNNALHLNDNRCLNLRKSVGTRFLNNRFGISVLHYERRDLRQLFLFCSQWLSKSADVLVPKCNSFVFSLNVFLYSDCVSMLLYVCLKKIINNFRTF